MNLTNQDSNRLFQINYAGTLPKATPATESMIAYGTVRVRGSDYVFPAGLPGKTLIVTSNKSTTTTAKTCTFTRSHFANPEQPKLSEIVAAINAAFIEASYVAASVGAFGELILTGEAGTSNSELTIGAGTANELLGFPTMGVAIANGTGVTFTLPAEMAYPDNTWLYSVLPNVKAATLTVATGVLTALNETTGFVWVFTPSARTLKLTDGSGDVARAIRASVSF